MAWSSDDDNEEAKGKKAADWFVQLLPFILIGLFWFFFKGRLGSTVMDTATWYSGIALAMYILAKQSVVFLEHKTAKLIYNPGFTTTDGKMWTVGSYGIFRRGAIHAYGVYYPGNDGLQIGPIDAINKVSQSVHFTCRFEIVSIDELPIEVRSFIIEKGWKGPYYFGLADEEQYTIRLEDKERISGLAHPSVGYLIDETKKLNRQVSLRERISDGDLSFVEKTVGSAKRISQQAKGGVAGTIKDWLKRDED